MIKKAGKILAASVIVLLAAGCFPSKNKASEKVFNNGDSWIPPEFTPQKALLLVQLLDEDVPNSGWRAKYKKWNNEMREYMKEKYPYKYEFVTADEIEHKGIKYSDYQKYPFGLMIDNGKLTYYDGAAGGTYRNKNTVGVFDYYFIDRSTGKKYPLTKKYSSNPVMTFMPVINTILEKR